MYHYAVITIPSLINLALILYAYLYPASFLHYHMLLLEPDFILQLFYDRKFLLISLSAAFSGEVSGPSPRWRVCQNVLQSNCVSLCQLTAKNIQCMRTLLNLAHCHGAVLGTSWQLVLATLQVLLAPHTRMHTSLSAHTQCPTRPALARQSDISF